MKKMKNTNMANIDVNMMQELENVFGEKPEMTPEQFCYWLQGFCEMTKTKEMDEDQFKMLKEHLALVFNKVTPSLMPNITCSATTITPSEQITVNDIDFTKVATEAKYC